MSSASNRDYLLEGGGLRVRFFFEADRLAHKIWQADGSDWSLVLSSVEGTPDDDWPPSPPLQSLNLESRADNVQLALLVGMAGKSHWSVSVELDATARLLTFDVACRVRVKEAGRLASGYQVHRPISSSALPSGLQLEDGGRTPLELALLESLGPARLTSGAGEICIEAKPVRSDPPTTVRWGYTVRAGS